MIPSFEEFKKNKLQGSDSTIKTQGNVQRKSTFPSFEEFKKINSSGQSNSPDYASINRRLEATQRQQQQEKIYSEPVDKLQNEQKSGVKSAGLSFLSGVSGALSSIGSGLESAAKNAQPSHGVFSGVNNSIKKGVENVGKSMKEGFGFAAEMIQENPNIVKEYQTFRDENGNFDVKKFKDPNVYLNVAASGLGSMSPILAGGLLGKGAAYLTAFMTEKGDAVDSYAEKMAEERGIDVSQLSDSDISKIDIASTGYGLVSGILETITPARFLKQVGKDGVREIARNIWQRVPAEALKSILIEGGTEGAQRFTQNVISKLAISDSQDISEGVIDEAIAGAILGGGLGVVGGALDNGQKNLPQKQIPEQKKNQDVNNPSDIIPPTTPPTATPGPKTAPVNPIEQEIQKETQDKPNTKVPELFSALESGDETQIASTIDSMSKNDLEAAKNVLEVAKSDERYTKDIPKEEVEKIDRHLEMINDLIDDKHIAIAKKAEEIISGGVTTQEIADLHTDDIPQAKKVVEAIKEKLDTKKSELLKEKAAVSSDIVAKKQIQEKINQVDESRHKIDDGLKKFTVTDDVLRKNARELQSNFNRAINSGDMDKAAEIRPKLRSILDEMESRKLEMIAEKTKKEFTDGMDPMVAGKANAVLNKETRVDGKATTKRKFVEDLASEKGSSAVIEKKTLKSGEKVDSMRIYSEDETFFEVSKTEFDYFNYLKSGNINGSKESFVSSLTKENKNASVKSYQQKPYETVDTNSRGQSGQGKLPGDVSVGTSESEGTGKSDKFDDEKGQIERGKQSDNAGKRVSDGRKLIEDARKYKTADEFVKAQTIYRGQPEKYKFKRAVSEVDASDNILIGKGIFNTSDSAMARTYGENILEYRKPIERILDISNASLDDLKKLRVDENTIKVYQDVLKDVLPARILGQTVEFVGKKYKIFRIVNVKGEIMYELQPIKYGEKAIYKPIDEMERMVKPKRNLSNIKDAEDILMNSIIERFTGGKSVEALLNGGSSEAGKLKAAKEQASKWLNKQGYDFIKHQGGVRAGGGQELHDVFIALSDEALKPLNKSQLIDIWKEAHKNYSKQEIENLVNSKESFTDAEKEILKQYEGSGGQKEGSGRGVLDEYYTPQAIVDKMWDLVKINISIPVKNVLEPSSGVGRFFDGAQSAQIDAFETNQVSAKIAKILHPDANVTNGSFESLFVDEKGKKKTFEPKYDVVIGNPPYGAHRGKYKGLGEESKISRYEEYFMKRSLDLTKEGGIVAMIVPSGFLRGGESYSKKEIAKLGKLIEAYRMPNGSFGTTDIGTDILVFKKNTFNKETERIETRVAILSEDMYFQESPSRVLGTEGERKGRFGMEKAVKGTLDEAIQKMQIESDIAQDIVENAPAIELEQRMTEKVVSKARDKSRKATLRETKSKKSGKDTGISGLFKRSKETPHIVESVKKAKLKSFTQGNITETESKFIKNTEEDGSISGDISNEDKALLNYAGGKYFNDFNYYQGDIREKIAQLDSDKQNISQEQYERQKAGLEAILPKEVSIDRITILPISTLAKKTRLSGGETMIDSFSKYMSDLPYAAFEGSSKWEIAGYINGNPVSGSDKASNAKIRVRRRKVGNKLFKKFYNEELEASDKKIIEDAYNKSYNNYHKPDYAKFPLKIEMYDKFYGKDFHLKDIQMEGAAFLVNKGVGILAYEVGVGKTLSGIAAITGVMQKGWAKKPLIIVPKNLKSKWIKDMAESMPNIRINDLDNLGGGLKYSGDRSKLYIEEGTLSIITEEGFKRIGFKDETYTRLTDGLEDVMYEKDAKKNKRSQEIEKANTEQIIGKAMKNTDFPVSFEDLGFDHITIDEAHRAKSVFSKAKAKGKGRSSNEYGAVRGSVSERGLKTYLATQYILEQNKGRNVFLLTATPFNNSPIEIYSMLSLVAKARFEQLGIKNINDFISLFVDLETKYAIKANGTAVQTDQVRNFQNLQQLQALVREYIDFRTGDEAGIQRPNKEKKTPSLKMTALQSDLIQKAQELFSPELRKEGGTLRAITELQKITLSPYLSQYSDKNINQVSPKELVESSPKIKYTVEAIKKVHSVNKNVGQIIYAEKGIEVFEPIRQHFIQNLGYKVSEVAIIDSSLSADAKDLAQQRFQNGEIRVLLASGTVKEGVDLQKNSTDIYNLWLPWNPTDMIQAEGRTWRQGSLYDNVRVHYPLIQNSIDPFIFQKLDEKASRLSSVFSYKGDTLDVSDIDFEGMKFDLITDPTLKVQAQFDYKEAELKDSLTVAEAELAFIERRTKKIVDLEESIKDNEKYLSGLDPKENEHSFKYYSDKIAQYRTELKDERLKLEKRGINVSEIEKKSLAKKEEIAKAKDSIEKLNEQLGKDLAIAKETHLGNMGGSNDYNAILKDMTDKSFFTVSGKEYTGKFNEDIKLPSLSRIDELHGMSDSQLLNSYELGYAKKIVEKFKKSELTPEYANQLVFDITQKILMPDESGNSTADAYYKKSVVYANLSGKSREVAFGLLRHELTHDINHLLRGTEHDKILLDWYRGMSEIDVIKLFKTDKNDTIQERADRYNQYSQYLKEKTRSFEEYEYFMANEAAAHARQFYPSSGINLDKTFYEKMKSIIRRIISLISRNSEYRYSRLMKSYDRFFNPKGSITISESARAQYDKARESLNERIFEVAQGDFNRYKEAIASISSSKSEPTMLSMAEKKDLVTPKGKVSIADLYRKVYADLYETNAPPLNSLSEEKVIRGMTKRSFTLGKRYATKITKANYKKVNTEIKDYIVKNIKDVEKRGSLVRAIISAKNANDTKIIIKRVDDIVDYQKALSAAKKLVIETIKTRQLLKTDNLRKAMKLPLIHNMSLEQLQQYFEALNETEVGDDFLTQRMIETVRFTELKGIATVKGVRKVLDKKLGDNFAKKGITINPFISKMQWDTALAESNEFMRLLVQEKDMAFLQADAKTLIAEEEINTLAKASRRSKERTLIEKIVPEDEAVFKYLESSDKPTLAQDMTTEQLALASYLETEFEKMRDYLIQNEQLKKYRENYITHIRKDFIEKWKSDGLWSSIKSVFDQQKADEAAFEILSGETEEIIPFEKWFQFAMRRSGAIDPSKNVMKAFLSYKLSFERKVALDSLIPKIMTYVYSLTPSKTTDRGLVMDRRLKKFVTSWLNSKKGRKFDFGGFIQQGSKADTILLAVKSLTSILDLGLSIPIGIASNVGEQSSNFIFLGLKQYLKGVARAQTSRGEKFLAKYENFVGKTPWKSISSGATHIGDKIMGSLFYLFHSSQVRANKHFLLGAITDEEYANGEVSIERLAQMKVDMGRWRVVEGSKSVIGNTSVGGVVSQYKTWAVVILRTSVKNIETVAKTKDFSSREAQETIRQALLLSTVGLITLMAFGGDDKDKSFLSTLYQKIVRDALSSLSAIDPTLYIASPRSLTFLVDLSSSIKSILKLEEYKTSKEGSYREGDLKGVNKLERTVTPSVIKQLQD